MKKLMLTVALVIGMVAATFANEKEVKLTLEENKLHYNFYSTKGSNDLRVDQASQLVLKTDNGITVALNVDQVMNSQKGYNSESISMSFDLEDYEADLLSKREVVEVALRHANGVKYHSLQD